MIDEALKYYPFIQPIVTFIRHNENMTYEISDGGKKYLLRIHKAAEGLDFSMFYGDTPRNVFIKSEIELLIMLQDIATIKTQSPIKNIIGEYVTRLESGYYVTVLSWLEGDTLVNTTITENLVYQMGQMIGSLHNATSQLPNLNRSYYDDKYIDRISYEIHKVYQVNHISKHAYVQIEKMLGHIRNVLIKERRRFLLIHDDLSKSNIIYNYGSLSPIDFSLSGYGIPEMELGEIIACLGRDEFIPYLIAGYNSKNSRTINKSYIKAFTALSIVLYIVIHHNRCYQEDIFINNMERWCKTFFIPVNWYFESNYY